MTLVLMLLIVVPALLPFYLQATCERILRHEFDAESLRSAVSANRLEFLLKNAKRLSKAERFLLPVCRVKPFRNVTFD